MPSERRAPREVWPSTATARSRLRARILACWAARPARVVAHAGRRRTAGVPGSARAWPKQSPGQGTGVKTVQDHPDRLLVRRPVPAGERVPRSTQAGQVRLAGPFDPLPDRDEPVVPGGSERAVAIAIRQASGKIRPCGERGSGRASRRCHVSAGRSPDSTTRAPTRNNARTHNCVIPPHSYTCRTSP